MNRKSSQKICQRLARIFFVHGLTYYYYYVLLIIKYMSNSFGWTSNISIFFSGNSNNRYEIELETLIYMQIFWFNNKKYYFRQKMLRFVWNNSICNKIKRNLKENIVVYTVEGFYTKRDYELWPQDKGINWRVY